MKTISIQEIRETLATNDAEGLCVDDLYSIFLEGCKGYNNYTEAEVVDWYVSQHGPDSFVEDSNPVKILEVTVSGKVKFEVWQQEWELDIKEV